MNFLFDISDEEPRKKKPRKKKASKPAAKRNDDDGGVIIPPPNLAEFIRLDDLPCLGIDCDSHLYDIEEARRKVLTFGRPSIMGWLVRCCFCGTGQWIEERAGILPEQAGGAHVFKDGVFVSKSVQEVYRLGDAGVSYVRWCAENGRRKESRDACRDYLEKLACTPDHS